MKALLTVLKKYALYIAFMQAWAATLGSLYFSEILKYPPCNLCWFQRIFMYPLIFILGVGISRKDKNVPYYVLPLATIGAIIGVYQYILQMSAINLPTPCDVTGVSCKTIQFALFGFITIPFLSLSAFLVIILMMLIYLKSKK